MSITLVENAEVSEGPKQVTADNVLRDEKGRFVKGAVMPEDYIMRISKWKTGRHLSESTKLKISLSNKGKTVSSESRRKMSESKKGKRPWNRGLTKTDPRVAKAIYERTTSIREKNRKAMLGKKLSEAHKAKIRELKKRAYLEGEIPTAFKRKEKHPKYGKPSEEQPNWKGGITPIHKIIRHSEKFVNWRKQVFERDDYTCQICNKRNGNRQAINLNAHHIKTFSKYPSLRFDINNGITLCSPCHNETKGKEEKFEEFFKSVMKL